MEPVTLYLTVGVSPNTTSNPGQRDLVGAGEAMKPSITQDSKISPRTTVAAGFSGPEDHLPGESATSMPPEVDGSAGMSPAESNLHDADEAMTTINISKTREGALGRIQWVMDALSPVAEVRHNVLLANPYLSRILSSASPVCEDGI